MIVRLKRWGIAALLALFFMAADVVAMVAVTRAFLPDKPPRWATGIFFWALAWPVPALSLLFPNTAGGSDRGPSAAAIAIAAVLDALLLTLLIRWLLDRRHRRAA